MDQRLWSIVYEALKTSFNITHFFAYSGGTVLITTGGATCYNNIIWLSAYQLFNSFINISTESIAKTLNETGLGPIPAMKVIAVSMRHNLLIMATYVLSSVVTIFATVSALCFIKKFLCGKSIKVYLMCKDRQRTLQWVPLDKL